MGASVATLALALATAPAVAAPLQGGYTPAANNGGGAAPGRGDIITIANGSDTTVTGNYGLTGTSGRPFEFNNQTIAERQAQGEVVSGFDQIDGRNFVSLTGLQKTAVTTVPDTITGTNAATPVYDNAKLVAVDGTSQRLNRLSPTGRAEYGDLRLADISASAVTIATGNPAGGLYDTANYAQLTSDSGSTLYNVTAGSSITYASRTATISGGDQDGVVQAPERTFQVPITIYSGVAFGNGDAVTDVAGLQRYNTFLIGQLNAGQITPTQYESLIQAAAPSALQDITVRQENIPSYRSPATTSGRYFILLDDSSLTTTVGSQLVGASSASGNLGEGSLVGARNGSTVVNNGQIVQGQAAAGIVLADGGTTFTNAAGGVIGVGYETLDRPLVGAPVPIGSTGFNGGTTNQSAIVATGGATVTNLGIVNVANRDANSGPAFPQSGKGNSGIVVGSGATASNQGTILIGGADNTAADAPGAYRGAAGMVALAGGSATNAAGGTIRVGTTFAENAADLAALADVASLNPANGLAALQDGGTLSNEGTIRVGGLSQNANGILVGGGSTATNAGTITLDPSAATTAVNRNAAISVVGRPAAAGQPTPTAAAAPVDATNLATGQINVQGVNSVGLLVRNGVAGGTARAVNLGTITVDGGLSVDRLRNFAVFVEGGSSSALQAGSVVLNGEGAIGVHARDGGTIDVGPAATLTFGGANEVGYYLLGAGSTINFTTAAAPTVVGTAGSTGVRVENGARLTGTGVNLVVSGANATGIVASGPSTGTTLDTTGAAIAVSGANAIGVRVGGGATGVLGASIALNGDSTVAAVVDGQRRTLNGDLDGAPVATTSLTSSANLSSGFANVVGYVAANQGQLTQNGTIAFTGPLSTGIQVGTGADVVNNGAIVVADGTGVLVDGAGSTLAGGGAITANNGAAGLLLRNGGSAAITGSVTGGGTADAILLDTGAGSLTLGGGTVTSNGGGNGIENVAGSAIRLNGTTVVANGSGSGIRTAVNLDPASTGTITAAGTNSTALTFAGVDGATTTGDASVPAGVTLTATGARASGLRLATTGNANLSGTIRVTAANGGSALIGGPAAAITNTGTLASASTTAPVVDLTGGTLSFTNTGTIAAPTAAGPAILGGGNGQAVTLAGGSVTGAVQLGAGADTFLMSGGTFAGSLDTGAGDDLATFRNLNDASLAGVTRIAGGGVAGGNDRLVFDNTQSTGTRRIAGFNSVALTNGSTLTSDGDLALVSGGTLTIAQGSTFFAGNSVNGAVAGSVANAGTIDLTNGSSGANDTLTVRGNYAGGGTLRLDTVLSATGPSDRLVIDGGTVSGTTTIAVVNAGGLGAATTGNGIELVSGINGAVTTATTGGGGFTLAGGQIEAGAFQYRLFASDPQGSQSFYLRSQSSTGIPIFRPEVGLLSGLQEQMRHQDLDMLGTYHQRVGGKFGRDAADGFSVPGRLWGRAIYDDYKIRNRNVTQSTFDGRAYGFQIGVDAFEFGTGTGRHQVGFYGGYLDGHASVRGVAGGLLNQYLGRTDPKTAYVGGYWTWLADSGFYVDTVVQHAWYNGRANSAAGNRIGIDGTGVLASVEAGYAIPLTARLSIEPQAQLIGQGVSLDDQTIPNGQIRQKNPGTLTGRLGARLFGSVPVGQRTVEPYLRANLWKQFASTDRTTFANGPAQAVILTRTSSFYGQAGAGLTFPVAPNVAFYGEGDYRFTLDRGQGITGNAINGSVGVKMAF